MHRIFVEKLPGFDAEARHLFHDLHESLRLDGLRGVRVVNRYDVDGLSDAEFAAAARLIFSEPQVDVATEELGLRDDESAFAVEYLPGQFDQRADSAAQCVQILTGKDRPRVASARVIVLQGPLDATAIRRVKDYLINKVDSHEASMERPESLEPPVSVPADVAILNGLTTMSGDELATLRTELGLAMSVADLEFCQGYFRDSETRDPSITEIRLLDTYWSDHCRHTTFLTRIREVSFDDESSPAKRSWEAYLTARDALDRADKPITLMDIALIGMRELRASGELDNLEISDEVNAASIIVPVAISESGEGHSATRTEEWLVMFKNETHNHPTEIEPFGGAATCLGGAIRDPLSGRAYVYQAMRVTGAADPRTPFSETLPGKLPQKKICQVAAHGYSSYGNQIGLATGQVSEVYHPGYVAKRMEIGAVIAAAPRSQVFRGSPAPGDVILLLGGRTGRDGVGGATGSSKEHDDKALENSAEVQKGDPPTERKIQRLFRKPELARKIKVCNDFGAGGVSVAIGEIAPSLDINLDAVPKKYDGLDGTELAISESQERMAVCVDSGDVEYFIREADRENLECVQVATVADHGRLKMSWRGKTIVDLSRKFLDTNGVQQDTDIRVSAPTGDLANALRNPSSLPQILSDLNVASQKGLGERFDASIGAATVLHPFGGEHQLTPPDAMVAKLPLIEGETDRCTYMSWGFNPQLAAWSPYHGALYAVTESVCRAVSAGARLTDIRLTFQEYFPKPGTDPARWGLPFAALLGAYEAQRSLRLAAIGGKDSMSGSFNDLDVPPTLVSFAVAPGSASLALSPEFKQAGSTISLMEIARDSDGIPDFAQLREVAESLHRLNQQGKLLALHTPGRAGMAAAVAKMSFGNHIGAEISCAADLFQERYFSFIIEHTEPLDGLPATVIGKTVGQPTLTLNGHEHPLAPLLDAWTAPLASIYPTKAESASGTSRIPLTAKIWAASSPAKAAHAVSIPRVVIPVFPGTNCEYDSARAFRTVGADPEIVVFRNLTAQQVEASLDELARAIRTAQILMIPGGFSAGDEPDGSGKFIATVLRNPQVADAVMDLIRNRDGLILGICNGFQALVKTGLVPFGEIRDPQPGGPTLTYNDIGRHVSCYVRTRVVSTHSPWLALCRPGDIHRVPVSHGEGKFHASNELVQQLADSGQIATQYLDANGMPSMEIEVNPNGSLAAIEGISSPCGRVFGKMAHTERQGTNVAKNIPGEKYQPIFQAGVAYFQ
jgi:phosphoribosylformylglycinamidine synthase